MSQEKYTISKIRYITIEFPDGTQGKLYYIDDLPLEQYFNVISYISKIKDANDIEEQNKLIAELVFACTKDIERKKFFTEIPQRQLYQIYELLMNNLQARTNIENVEAKKNDT